MYHGEIKQKLFTTLLSLRRAKAFNLHNRFIETSGWFCIYLALYPLPKPFGLCVIHLVETRCASAKEDR